MRGPKTIPMPQRNGRGPDNSTIEKAMDIRLDACSVHCVALRAVTRWFFPLFFSITLDLIFLHPPFSMSTTSTTQWTYSISVVLQLHRAVLSSNIDLPQQFEDQIFATFPSRLASSTSTFNARVSLNERFGLNVSTATFRHALAEIGY